MLARWWAVLVLAVVLIIVGSALLAALFSKARWGYFVSRPAVNSRLLSARQVLSVTPLEQLKQPDGSWFLVPAGRYDGPGWYERERLADPQEFDYYLLDRRPLRALECRGVLTAAVPPLRAEQLPDLASLLRPILAAERSGLELTLEQPTGGPPMSGTLYELVDARGERLVLLAICGCAVSNDHFPYFELLYEVQGNGKLVLVAKLRFYFDVAGLEGMDFSGMFVGLSVMGLAMIIPLIGGVMLVRHYSSWGAVRRGWCPKCRYDLLGQFAAGCPECGWGRGEQAKLEQNLSRYTPINSMCRRLSRPPIWCSIGLALTGTAMLLVGSSSPGRNSEWMRWGVLLWLLAGVLQGLDVRAVKGRAGHQAGRSTGLRWRVGAVLALAGLTYWAVISDAALRGRFQLSRRAMDRLVAEMPYSPGKAPRRAGLFQVHSVIRYGEAVLVIVPGPSLPYTGFVCFPDEDKPEEVTAFGRILECTPIVDGWYSWRYLDP